MAPAMSYALRADPVLTKDGKDVLDGEDLRLMLEIREAGVNGAAERLGISERTVRRRIRRIEERSGGKVLDKGRLDRSGLEMIERMELYVRLLDEQLQHLWGKPSLTCDGLLVRKGKVLLVKRGKDPFRGCHALPGGFVEYGESAEDCVVREVKEETGLDTEVLRMIGVYSEMGRDPRGHFVSLLYLLREKGGALKAGDDAESAGFFDPSALPEMAFDHGKMIRDGLGATEHPL